MDFLWNLFLTLVYIVSRGAWGLGLMSWAKWPSGWIDIIPRRNYRFSLEEKQSCFIAFKLVFHLMIQTWLLFLWKCQIRVSGLSRLVLWCSSACAMRAADPNGIKPTGPVTTASTVDPRRPSYCRIMYDASVVKSSTLPTNIRTGNFMVFNLD